MLAKRDDEFYKIHVSLQSSKFSTKIELLNLVQCQFPDIFSTVT